MNELNNLEHFQVVLKNYTVSDHARSVLQKTKLVLLAGVSAAGRNAVVNELIKTNNYHYIVSDTTRKPRINHGQLEQDGREYWFRTEEQFLNDLKNGEYVEAAIIHNQQVSGISIREIELASKEGKIATTDIEIIGVRNIEKVKPDAVSVFMLPPSFEEWLKRLGGRGEMHAEEVRRRLESAVVELQEALTMDYYVLVVNDEFHHTTRIIDNIYESQPDQKHARNVAQELLKETKKYLGSL